MKPDKVWMVPMAVAFFVPLLATAQIPNPPTTFTNGTTMVQGRGFSECVAPAPNVPCEGTTEIVVCPPGVNCPTAEAFLNGWSIARSATDRYKKIHIYVQKLSYTPSTGTLTVKYGGVVDYQGAGAVIIGVNWSAVGENNQITLRPTPPQSVTCSGTSAALCNIPAPIIVSGGATLSHLYGFALKEFLITTDDYVDVRHMGVDITNSTVVGASDAQLTSAWCGLIGNTLGGASPPMRCTLETVAISVDQTNVYGFRRDQFTVGATAPWYDFDQFTAPVSNIVGFFTGLERWDVSLATQSMASDLSARCDYIEFPPSNCPPGGCGPDEVFIQWSGGVNSSMGPYNAHVYCTQGYLK